MQPVHYYHAHCGYGHVASRWKPVVEEHFAALEASGFDGEVFVGLVGDPDKRDLVMDCIRNLRDDVQLTACADEGYEQVTIEALHRWTKFTDPGTPVLYCHTKGSYQDTPFNRAWRRAMTEKLVGDWKYCTEMLRRYDAIGCHWLTHDEFPVTVTEGKPMFGGNFWWARAGYLASLLPVEGGDPLKGYNRYKAEEWVGQGSPKVLDLNPGWPDYPQQDGEYDSILGGRIRA